MLMPNWLPYILQYLLRYLMGKLRPVRLPPRPYSCVAEGDMYCSHAHTCALTEPEPAPPLERVKCNCPEYKGSDFWNDPHRWCDRDPVTEPIWQDKPERDCERTYRPVKQGKPVSQSLYNYLANYNYDPYGNLFGNLLHIGRVV